MNSSQLMSHVSKAVSNCFAALRRRLRRICRLVSQPVLLSLVTSLIMTRFDYGSATVAGLPGQLLRAEVRPRHTSSLGPSLVESLRISTGRTRFPLP